MSIEQAEMLGLPVDAGRVGSYGPNVSSLREFLRATPFTRLKHSRVLGFDNPWNDGAVSGIFFLVRFSFLVLPGTEPSHQE